MIGIRVEPRSVLDAKTKRLIDKELRAAWGAKGSRWDDGVVAREGAVPTVHLWCNDRAADSVAIALQTRMGLAHFVHAMKSHMPEWAIQFAASGTGGELQLEWNLDAGPEDAVESLMGRLPQQRVFPSPGRQFWDERDGGISLLSPGTWKWDPRGRTWRLLPG
jgi:hypothetical protein